MRLMRLARTPKAPEIPLATIAKVKGAQRLIGLDARAQALGLTRGMGLASARAMHPGLLVAQADLRAEREVFAAVLAWCRRFTPLIAADGEDGLMLDISGVAHLFGGEAGLCAQIEQRLAAQGFGARVGIGPNPFAASAIARFSQKQILPPEVEDARLPKIFGHFPLAALGLGSQVCEAMAQAGLRRVEDVFLRPRAPIAARFGTDVLARLDQLLGLAKNPILPQFSAPDFSAERRFADGLTQESVILANIHILARDLGILLERHGVGARKLGLTLFRVDGVVREVQVGTSRPLREAAAIVRLFSERLAGLREDGFETGYGFDVLRLDAQLVEPTEDLQTSVLPQTRVFAPEKDGLQNDHITDLVDRLGARLGTRRITRLQIQDSHIPELADISVPAAPFQARQNLLKPSAASPLPERPLHLLKPPEPIETIAKVPDGPPMRFRWRRALHEVVAIEGPERIAPEWWKRAPKALTRDYFRAEDAAGQRFWLFREGILQVEHPHPAWFIHGLFA